MTISTHAKERAFERYGVRFSKKKWKLFERTIRNEKQAIQLPGDRLACYFEKQWFLVIYKGNGTVLTFLSLEDASDEDKQVLRHDEQYRRINIDAFRVLERNSTTSEDLRDVGPVERSVDLPTMLTEDELPKEVLESAKKLMERLCK